MRPPRSSGINYQSFIGEYYDWTSPDNPKTGTADTVLHARFGTNLSSSHRRVNGKFVDGGSWWMMKEENTLMPSNPVTVIRAGRKAYSGSFVTSHAGYNPPPNWWNVNNAGFRDDIWNQISNDVAGAYNRCKPTKPDFSLAVSLYELKDVPGMLKQATRAIMRLVSAKARRRRPGRTEEWYLAIQFGWVPLLSDIRKFADAQRNGQRRLAQLIRDEGKPVRRGTKMRNPWDQGSAEENNWRSVSVGQAYNTSMSPLLVTQCYGGGDATTSYQSGYEVNTWAEGQFRYLLPPGPRNVDWTRNMRRRLMGARVTPSEVYQIMPWSWLVDYFTNLGDFIETTNSGVADRLISDYFFVMNSYEWYQTTTSTQFVYTGKDATNPKEVTASRTTKWVNKSRWPVSTFGVGVTQGNLSPYQVSILGALGKSRLT